MLGTAEHQVVNGTRAQRSHRDDIDAAARCENCPVRDLALCGALDDDDLRTFGSRTLRVTCQPGESVFFEYDDADTVYTIERGTVRLSKLLADGRRQVVGFFGPGDVLGTFGDETCPYSAEALDNVILCRMRSDTFETMREQFPEIERRLAKFATLELTRAQTHLALLGTRKPLEKLALFLLSLRERMLGEDSMETTLELPMNRIDIADYLGMTIETVSRSFTQLRKDGLIALPEPQIVVFKDLDALEDLAI